MILWSADSGWHRDRGYTFEIIIITSKYNSYRRLDSLKQDNTEWIRHVDNIIKTYSFTEHILSLVVHDMLVTTLLKTPSSQELVITSS